VVGETDSIKILGAAHVADCRRFSVQFTLGCLYEAEHVGDGEMDELDAALQGACALLARIDGGASRG